MDITVIHSISLARLKDFLDSAGRGSAYWCDSPLQTMTGVEEALTRRGIIVTDMEQEPSRQYPLNIMLIQKGLQLMAEKQPMEFTQIVVGEHDNATGDTFMQYALFGDVIYG